MKPEMRALQNRVNALKAKGAKAFEAIERTKRNALKHGLLAEDCVLSDEEAAAFDEFREELIAELEPAGEVESFLADQIASTIWRLRRIPKLERDMIDHDLAKLREFVRKRTDPDEPPATLGRVFKNQAGLSDAFSKLRRYEAHFERSVKRNLHELERRQLRRTGAEVEAPKAVDVTVSVDDAEAKDAA